jgi:multidrug resistance efflux pump
MAQSAPAQPRPPAPERPTPASANGLAAAPPAAARRSPIRRILPLAILLALAIGGGTVGWRWYEDSLYYVTTENAQVAGRLLQVGGLAAGRVAEVRYDVGQRVGREQVVARLYAPVPVGTTASGQPRLEFRQTEDALVEVLAPIDGVVVARSANPGDTVPAGQPILTLVDPRQLWVNANVEETQIRRVRPGQPVAIYVDALGQEVEGRVLAITPASAATFSLLPQPNLSGSFTKQTQLVPVKIELPSVDGRLTIGTSVRVRIRVLE